MIVMQVGMQFLVELYSHALKLFFSCEYLGDNV